MLSDPFIYSKGNLCCEVAPLQSIAVTYGTPAYVYSKNAIVSRFRVYKDALASVSHRICYSVKANSNLSVLRVLADEGCGFDIVSGGELFRLLQAGADASTVVFSGVGKTEAEVRFALEQRIHSFNCESESEIELISRAASALNLKASIAIRVNPDVDAITHPYISTGLREHKFGIDISQAETIYEWAASLPSIRPEGVSCHIGSQLLDPGPLLDAAGKVIALSKRLRARGLSIQYLDLGGGLGVSYRAGERSVPASVFIEQLLPKVKDLGLMVMIEPGRSIVAEAGVLLTRVLLVKRNGSKTFVVVDGAMNDLIRPALYQAHHEIVPVEEETSRDAIVADIVGPVCESGDFFARNREMPNVKAGDLLAIRTVGAYGFVLSSNYNSRPRACEVLVDGNDAKLVRRREIYEDLIRGEQPYSR